MRSNITTYRELSDFGTRSNTLKTDTYYYRYDSLNRVNTYKGDLVNGAIVRGAEGIDVTYNAAGERATSQTGNKAQEVYSYNDAGQLIETRINGSKIAETSYDLLGRVDGHGEYASGSLVHQRYDIVYDERSQVISEKGRAKQGALSNRNRRYHIECWRWGQRYSIWFKGNRSRWSSV